MKEIVFNDKTYSIPEKWEEVTVGMLIRSAELAEILEDAPIVAIISAYTGIPAKDLKSSMANEVQEIILIMQFIETPYTPIPAIEFMHEDVLYSCPDDLLQQRFEDWVSIQTALYNNREHQERVLPRMIAIMCKKPNEVLDDFDLNERTEIMMRLPMTVAKDVECFFLHSLNQYKSTTLWSSINPEVEKLVLDKVNDLQSMLMIRRAHSGIFSGTRLRIGICRLQLWWVRKVLVKYFNFTPSTHSKKIFTWTYKKSQVKKPKEESNGNTNSTL